MNKYTTDNVILKIKIPDENGIKQEKQAKGFVLVEWHDNSKNVIETFKTDIKNENLSA